MSRRRRLEPTSIAEAFAQLRELNQDYNAAKRSRYRRPRTGIALSGSGADYHYRSEADYLRVMEEARDMDRNDAIVGQTIDRAVDNQVQGGFTLDAQTPDVGLNDDLEKRFEAWAQDPEQCDLAGEMSFHDMERLVPRSTQVDGDIFALPTLDGSLQLVEAHRCRTPHGTKRNVVHGVLLDEQTRKRQEYWFTRQDVDPYHPVRLVKEIQPYPARDESGNRQVFHTYSPKRVSQTRGVSALTPIFDVAGMFEDIQFATLVQRQVVSCFAIIRHQSRSGRNPPSTDDPQYGARTDEALAGGATRRVEGIAPGMEITGVDGETIDGFSPNVPNPEYFPHVRLILTLIGINLGMPLVLVLMDGSETNFSGWRGAVDEARKGFRRNQRWLGQKFHSPVYRWKVRQWIAADSALAKAAKTHGDLMFAHKWNPPSWPYIQPMEDASADLLRIRNALGSPRRIHAERNGNFYEIIDETIEDNTYAIVNAKKKAAEINKQYPDDEPVHWREVISLPTPDGVNVTVSADKPSASNAKPNERSNSTT